MRISDWSSDVCSSDLHRAVRDMLAALDAEVDADDPAQQPVDAARPQGVDGEDLVAVAAHQRDQAVQRQQGDRKSVVSGKSVSVRVDLGGRRIIKKKKNNKT